MIANDPAHRVSIVLGPLGISDAQVALASGNVRICQFGTQSNRLCKIGDGLIVTSECGAGLAAHVEGCRDVGLDLHEMFAIGQRRFGAAHFDASEPSSSIELCVVRLCCDGRFEILQPPFKDAGLTPGKPAQKSQILAGDAY